MKRLRSRAGLLTEPSAAEIESIQQLVSKLSFGQLGSPRERRDFLLAKCLLAEVLDLRGKYQQSTALLADADDVRAKVLGADGAPAEADELNLFVQAAWFCVLRSVNDYRMGELELARARTLSIYEYLQGCRLERRFADLQFRLRQTLGRYLLETDPNEAQRYYTEALEYASARLDWILEQDGGSPPHHVWQQEERIAEEIQFSRFNMAVLNVGLARCHLDMGNLSEARGHLAVAETLLQRTGEEILRTYIRFLIGCVHRQRKGELEEAIRILTRCRDRFEKAGHHPFYLRCRYELAKAYFNRDTQQDRAEALRILTIDMSDGSRIPVLQSDLEKHELWDATTLLLKAQIHRAEGLPNLALPEGRSAKNRLAEIFARRQSNRLRELCVHSHLVNAEIAIDLKDTRGALSECADAEGLASADKTDRAWLTLVRIEAYLSQNEIGKALAERETLGEVENEHMMARARYLDAELQRRKMEGIWISPNTPDLNIEQHVEKLRKFLISRSVSMGGSDKEIAARLGVGPQTIANWRYRGEL